MKAFRVLATFCLGGVLSASVAIAADDEAAVLKQRARRLWEARVQDAWEVVFDLMPPEEQALSGERAAFAAYQKEKGPFLYLSAEIGDAVIDGDTAWVQVKFTTRPRLYPVRPTTVEKWDVWLKRDDWRPIPRAATHEFPTSPPRARNVTEDVALAKRVEEIWQILEGQDWRRLYDYLDPGYRAAMSMDAHLERVVKYFYLSHRVLWVETTGDTGRAKVTFTQKLNDPTLTKIDPEEKTAVEDWVRVDGQWFRNTRPRKDSQ